LFLFLGKRNTKSCRGIGDSKFSFTKEIG